MIRHAQRSERASATLTPFSGSFELCRGPTGLWQGQRPAWHYHRRWAALQQQDAYGPAVGMVIEDTVTPAVLHVARSTIPKGSKGHLGVGLRDLAHQPL